MTAKGLTGRRSVFIPGVAAQVKAADALDGDDAAAGDDAPGLRNGLPAPLRPAQQIHFGAAVVAAHRLGVVAPRFGVGVFVFAGRTHGKGTHAGTFPVIGHGVENRQARPAGRAVDEGMEIAPVRRVEELGLAGVADSNIGRNEDMAFFSGAFYDVKG